MLALQRINDAITIPQEFAVAKMQALVAASGIEIVSDETQQTEAVEVQKRIAEILKLTEASRKELKAPVIALGRAIDGCADEFSTDLKKELIRVAALIGDYQQELADRAREEARKAAAIQARIEREAREEQERIERERLAAEESARRIAMEEAARASNSDELKAAQERAKVEADRIEQEAKRKQDEAAKNAQQALSFVPTPSAPQTSKGQTVREDWDITVTNIQELYRFHPNCVKMEPLMSEIRSVLAGGYTLKGVTAKRVIKSSVRTSTAKLVDV